MLRKVHGSNGAVCSARNKERAGALSMIEIVADTVFTRILATALEVEGSSQALANALHVPEGTLQRWMSGRASMPVQAFLKLLKYVELHEARFPEQPRPPDSGDGHELA